MKIISFLLALLLMGIPGWCQQEPVDSSKFIKPDVIVDLKPDRDTILEIFVKKGQKIKLDLKEIKVTTEQSGWKKFRDRLTLRQSFQNVKDKDEAAFINLVYPKDSASSKNFSFALGYNLLKSELSEAQLNPFLEWQKNTLIAKKQDVVLAGLNFQAPLWGWTELPAFMMYAVSAVNYKKDDVNKTKGLQVSLYLTPVFANVSGRKFLPLPDVEMRSSFLRFVYNVYAGLEYEDRKKTKDPAHEGNVWRCMVRANGKLYPFSKLIRDRLEIVPEITYRYGFVNNTTIEKRENIMRKISFNIIILDKSKDAGPAIDVKVGFDHVHGIDPTKGFDGQRVNTLGVKVKI